MRGGLEPYPAYRDSGVEWLGEVPAHWELRRLKTLSQIRYGLGQPPREVPDGLPLIRATNVSDGQIIEDGMMYVDPTDVPTERNAFLSEGEIVVVRSGAYTADSAIVPKRYSGAVTGYDMVVTVTGALPEFVAFAVLAGYIRRDQLTVASLRAAQPHLNAEELGSALTLVPSPREQASIARFLDHADRRIRRYIRAKERLIELLEEQKQAIVHQAVTGQIDVRTGQPYPAYKESGVEWLGETPEHWELKRLKWVLRLQRGYDLPVDQRKPGPYPVVSSGGVIGTHSECRCNGPGIVMGRYGSTESVFFIEQDFWPHNTSLFVTNCKGNSKRWCYYLLRSIGKGEHAGKSAVPGLNRNHLFQIVVGVPAREEQRAMVKAIDRNMRNLNDALVIVENQIRLVREYWTCLIADVVTGKLDVREAAASLPEVDPPDPEALHGLDDNAAVDWEPVERALHSPHP